MIITESIRYAGSKAKILDRIKNIIQPLKIEKTLDGFSGSTRVSQLLKQMNYTVHSNDLAIYSKVLSECYLLNTKEKDFYIPIINHLNKLNPIDGWFSKHYGGIDNNGLSIQNDGKKKPFQLHNTKKLDAIRIEIENLYPIDCIEKSVLLTSLILGLDKVQNDLGHQVAYLKKWNNKTFNKLTLEVPKFFIDNKNHKVFNKNIFDINEEYDLIYLDPPYGTSNEQTPTSRVRYFSYYHLWTTIIKNDKPLIFGAAGRREDVSSDTKQGAVSIFENTNLSIVENSFYRLFSELKSKYFLLSYSNRSKVSVNTLLDIANSVNNLKVVDALLFEHTQNSQANSLINGKYKTNYEEKNMELLLLLEKN